MDLLRVRFGLKAREGHVVRKRKLVLSLIDTGKDKYDLNHEEIWNRPPNK